MIGNSTKVKAKSEKKPGDPRHAIVKAHYIAEFEKRDAEAKAEFDGSDGKQLSKLLSAQPQASAEVICRWLDNAFASDDVPLRKGFRLREFC